jgi:hypothetical protein
MSISIIEILTHAGVIVTLINDAEKLVGDLKSLTGDAKLAPILAANPAIAADVAVLSGLWRTVENDEVDVARDKNFFSKLAALNTGSKDLNKLFTSLAGFVNAPEVVTFLATAQGEALPSIADLKATYADIVLVAAELGETLPPI